MFKDIKTSFWVLLITMLIVVMFIAWTIATTPPDTRTEYQKLYDRCVINTHDKYMTIDSYGKCSVIIDDLLTRGWDIVGTPSDRYGTINSYVLQK